MTENPGSSAVIDRRSKPRIKCTYAAIVHGIGLNGKKFEENATVLNLSAGGVYMVLPRFIQSGQELSVRIAFPTKSLEHGPTKLATNGVVVRTEPYLDGILGIAIKFQNYRFV